MQTSARAREHLGQRVEGTRSQSQGHWPDLDVDDLAVAAEGNRIPAVGREELEGVSVAHSRTVETLKTVFKFKFV